MISYFILVSLFLMTCIYGYWKMKVVVEDRKSVSIDLFFILCFLAVGSLFVAGVLKL